MYQTSRSFHRTETDIQQHKTYVYEHSAHLGTWTRLLKVWHRTNGLNHTYSHMDQTPRGLTVTIETLNRKFHGWRALDYILSTIFPVVLQHCPYNYFPSRLLRFSREKLPTVPMIILKSFDGRMFAFVAPAFWNFLYLQLTQVFSWPVFKQWLKVHLFRCVFVWYSVAQIPRCLPKLLLFFVKRHEPLGKGAFK